MFPKFGRIFRIYCNKECALYLVSTKIWSGHEEEALRYGRDKHQDMAGTTHQDMAGTRGRSLKIWPGHAPRGRRDKHQEEELNYVHYKGI